MIIEGCLICNYFSHSSAKGIVDEFSYIAVALVGTRAKQAVDAFDAEVEGWVR